MFAKLAPYAKAIAAFLLPGIALLCGPLLAGRMPTGPEYLIALGTSISAAVAVFLIPNGPAVVAPAASEGTEGLPDAA